MLLPQLFRNLCLSHLLLQKLQNQLNDFLFIRLDFHFVTNVEDLFNQYNQIESMQVYYTQIYNINSKLIKMGNTGTSYIEQKLGNPFYATDKNQDSEAAQVLKQFKLVSTYQDQLFDRCSVIEHKQTAELIIAKQINCTNEQEMNRLYSQFQRRRDMLTCQNLIRLRYLVKKKTDGLFGDHFKIILFFDYVLTNAIAQYNNRLQKSNPFSPDQLNIILAGAIKGYSFLQSNSIPNDKVRLRNIYFGIKQKTTNVKVVDSKLFPTDNNVNIVRNRSENFQDVFLAPEELRSMNVNGNGGSGGRIGDKSGVFSLGVCMMQLCLLQPCRVLYNYQNGSIDYKEIQTRLNIIKNKYPLSVYYIIRQMLQRNQDSRPSFTKLSTNLPTNIKNLPQSINLSLVNRTTQHITKQPQMSKQLPPLGYSKSIAPTPLPSLSRNMHQTSLASEYRPQVNSSQLYTNGNMYTGQKKDDLRHGKGKYLYADGSYYYGDWFKGKMEGNGKLYDADGNLEYEGQWKGDLYWGKGTLYGLTDVDWVKYVGEFKAGKMEGFGEMFFKDGNKYKGEFRADYPWGKGRMFLRNGDVKNGVWEKGQYKGEF